jgi:hypothetical protein
MRLFSTLLVILVCISIFTGCGCNKQFSKDAEHVEKLYAKALSIVNDSKMDSQSRARFSALQYEAEALWRVIQGNPCYREGIASRLIKLLVSKSMEQER